MSKFAGLALPEKSARMTIMHPVTVRPLIIKETGEEAWIELLPSLSDVGAAADRDTQDTYLRMRRRVTSTDTDAAMTLKLGKLTVKWKLAMLDGSAFDLDCSAENATEVYNEIRWLRDQVAGFVADFGKLPDDHLSVLFDYAEHQSRLDQMMPDGTSTVREMLESVERQTRKRPKDLDGPEIPPNVAYIWRWFLELCASRGSNGFGPNPLTYPDIESWSHLTGTTVRPIEVRALLHIDRSWLNAAGKAAKGRREFEKSKGKQPPSKGKPRPNGRR